MTGNNVFNRIWQAIRVRHATHVMGVGLSLLSVLLVAVFIQTVGAQIPESPRFAPGGAETCLGCHGATSALPAHSILQSAHGLVSDARTPMAEGNNQCQSCHGASDAHLSRLADGTRPPPEIVFNQTVSSQAKDAPCLSCHQNNTGTHWAGSTHQFEEVSCTSCHTLHVERRDPVLNMDTQAGVCFSCHTQQRSELLRPFRHPVQTVGAISESGLLGCTDCHNPHGSAGPSNLRRLSVNETCYDCHAETRGPFLWEHAPVREDCTTCHQPHGSVHAGLLNQRPPQLCQQCHLAQFHPSTVRSGLGVPPAGADQTILGQSCLNCHSNIHGSNHPSGVRFTR